MKHNPLTKALTKFVDSLEENISFARVKKEADKWRDKLKNAPKAIKIKNWDIL
jgi:hypothetical protein